MNSSSRPAITLAVYLQEVFTSNLAEGQSYSPISPDTWQNWFQTWLEIMFPNIPQADSYELSLQLTGDGEIEKLNAQYRHQQEPTDVLAFAALEVPIPRPADPSYSLEPLYLGDIVISLETAQRQALQQGHSVTTELAWLGSHGLLHLLGWDHPDSRSLEAMLHQQQILLKTVGLL